MRAVDEPALVSVEDYLAGESKREVRHEFIAGVLHAMAGASREHNIIAGNVFAALHAHLRGKPCRVFTADLKLRLRIASTDIFYYPDITVACDPRDIDRYFVCHPKVLVEVLSPETERTDRREKFLSYIQIDSLDEYVLIAQDRMEITVFGRAQQWQPEVLREAGQQLRLVALGFQQSVGSVYEGVTGLLNH